MKFRAHDTFYIRKGWLSKGMKCVKKKPDVFVAKDENPMDVLGVGANMAKAIRYWLQAVGLTVEAAKGKRVQALTPLGENVFAHDRYIEEAGTLCLLHYRLSSNKEGATAWFCFFNKFNMFEFARDDFVGFMQQEIRMEGEEVAARSLNDDFACIVNTYLAAEKANPARAASPESNMECPLSELGLLDIASRAKKTYRKAALSADALDPHVALAVIADQRRGREEISLTELLTAPCNIGKTFNLDAAAMLDVLYKIERLGAIKIVRTSGLDVIRLLGECTFEGCVAAYYAGIGCEQVVRA